MRLAASIGTFVVVLCASVSRGDAPAASQPGGVVVEARLLGSDKPFAGAKIEWNLYPDGKGSGETDAAGRCIVPGFTEQTTPARVSAKADGMVPLAIYWNKPKPGAAGAAASQPAWPPKFVFVMEKGKKISGLVVDEAGKPIAGATVVVSVGKTYAGSEQDVSIGWKKLTTDAQGAWSLDGVPADPRVIKIAAYDLMHL